MRILLVLLVALGFGVMYLNRPLTCARILKDDLIALPVQLDGIAVTRLSDLTLLDRRPGTDLNDGIECAALAHLAAGETREIVFWAIHDHQADLFGEWMPR